MFKITCEDCVYQLLLKSAIRSCAVGISYNYSLIWLYFVFKLKYQQKSSLRSILYLYQVT